ncbi:MAG: hypothetical protein QXY40_09145 [Candidatus Methanomethylicia archaeon]
MSLKDLIDITSFEGGLVHLNFLKQSLKIRTEPLKHISRVEAEKIAEICGGELVDLRIDDSTDWCVKFTPLPNFEIYIFMQRYSPEFEDSILALYSRGTLNWGIPAEDIAEWTILFVNAMIYACRRKLDKNIPRISHYL